MVAPDVIESLILLNSIRKALMLYRYMLYPLQNIESHKFTEYV